MSTPLQLCWWEVEELLEHMRSRPDIWTQSSDDARMWFREEPRNPATQAFALLILPPKDESSPFRLSTLQTMAVSWDEEYISSYLLWLVSHWTSFRRRTVVTKFLESELGIDPKTAPLAAIAVEGLSWDADETKEPEAPPLQDELWPREITLPADAFVSDPSLLGTYLLSGSAGWIQLRLQGGMIRASLHIRAKDSPEILTLQGFLRPTNGRTRDTAAAIAGWPVAELSGESTIIQQELPE